MNPPGEIADQLGRGQAPAAPNRVDSCPKSLLTVFDGGRTTEIHRSTISATSATYTDLLEDCRATADKLLGWWNYVTKLTVSQGASLIFGESEMAEVGTSVKPVNELEARRVVAGLDADMIEEADVTPAEADAVSTALRHYLVGDVVGAREVLQRTYANGTVDAIIAEFDQLKNAA
jgi:hypothetical protein